MKINVSFDITPEEFRKVMGLPDVQTMQKEVFNQMMEKMKAGEEGYDPMALYAPMMAEGIQTMDKMQQMMFSMMNAGSSNSGSSED
jgi:hypothetical protein